jgi:hypothetical protein
MQRSSESVAALASALAKAQSELVNPEKSLTATIKATRAGEADRTFRYAPLSSGLEIVRKTLGQHQIAAIQTTAIDQAAGCVNLTTMLAHASGEWISSDWPVCHIADMASPKRMGAALTYARRYALFTLVGIAGDDDLDAPDLNDDAPPPAATRRGPEIASEGGVQVHGPSRKLGNGHAARSEKRAPASVLPPDQSAAVREQLIAEIVGLSSVEVAAKWARDAMVAKNELIAPDAKTVEEAFEKKLTELTAAEPIEPSLDEKSPAEPELPAAVAAVPPAAQPGRIDKSVLPLAEPRRYRNREHLRFVAAQACAVCGRKPSDPHHLRFTQPRALGRKVSDEFAVPLCRTHHRAVHRVGNELDWWKKVGIDPIKLARGLWRKTRLNQGQKHTNGSTADVPTPHLSVSIAPNSVQEPTAAQETDQPT